MGHSYGRRTDPGETNRRPRKVPFKSSRGVFLLCNITTAFGKSHPPFALHIHYMMNFRVAPIIHIHGDPTTLAKRDN